MAVTSPPADGTVTQNATRATAGTDWRDPRYQAFALMRLAFTVAPIAFGLDKFFNVMVQWPDYLAPWINDIACLLYTSPSPRDLSTSRMPSSA